MPSKKLMVLAVPIDIEDPDLDSKTNQELCDSFEAGFWTVDFPEGYKFDVWAILDRTDNANTEGTAGIVFDFHDLPD